METVRVIYHEWDEGWWAESPDVDGWYAGSSTFEETRKLAEEGVRFALDRDDLQVEHYAQVKGSVPA